MTASRQGMRYASIRLLDEHCVFEQSESALLRLLSLTRNCRPPSQRIVQVAPPSESKTMSFTADATVYFIIEKIM
jgi:hypothetical protein